MSPQNQAEDAIKGECPLAANQGATISLSHVPSISEAADNNTAMGLIAGVHVVVVETSEGKCRRRVYFNLPSAQRAVDRATMAGHVAHLILCRLIPANGGEAL